jgi:AcrR family transcriptional regulator
MSPRNKEKDQQLRAERTKQILDSALTVIARRGLSATKVSDIAAMAGVSVGNIYKYFSSKEEIFEALLHRGQRDYREFAEQAWRQTGSAKDKLSWYTVNWLDKREWAITTLLQHARTSETVAERLKQAVSAKFKDNLRPIAAIIEEGQQNGEFVGGDSMELALIYVSMMEGLTLHDIPDTPELSSGIADRALQLLLRDR